MKEKIKNFIFNALMCCLLFLLFPFLLLLLIGSLLYTPIDFIKFKRSRHQKDFPRKYTWLCGRHPDNAAYTVTKERNLPVTYLQNNNPELTGVFLYKHTVLHFSNPFFFDDKKNEWLFWPHAEDEEADEDAKTEEIEEVEEDNTDDCLPIEAALDLIREQYRERFPDATFENLIFFYQAKDVKSLYSETALKQLEENSLFVPYEKKRLEEALLKYISEN